MKGWSDLLIELDTKNPDRDTVKEWIRRKGQLNQAHVGELRALAIAAENEAASALGVPGRQRKIGWPQWLLMHMFTFQRDFQPLADQIPPDFDAKKKGTRL